MRKRHTGLKPMMGAAQNKMSGSILDLHSRHANIDKKNMQGITPVHLACLGGDAADEQNRCDISANPDP